MVWNPGLGTTSDNQYYGCCGRALILYERFVAFCATDCRKGLNPPGRALAIRRMSYTNLSLRTKKYTQLIFNQHFTNLIRPMSYTRGHRFSVFSGA